MDALLFQRFHFKKPIEIEECLKGHEVIALKEKTIIRMDRDSEEHYIAELLSLSKLAEIDPLLATFIFQKNLSEQEKKDASLFYSLCEPLQKAWVYKLMRRYAPDIYEREVEELYEMFQIIESSVREVTLNSRKIVLGTFCVIAENPAYTADLQLITDEKNRADWESYIVALRDFVRREPDVQLYLQLPVITNAYYTVRINSDEKGMKFFEVKGKKNLKVSLAFTDKTKKRGG